MPSPRAQAAPQIQLLGTESWNQPDILAAAGKGIDGAVFADSFFVGSGTPSTADFVARFRAQNGYDPTGFEAQAYDAGMLVREAIAQGARTRGAVLQNPREPSPAIGRQRSHRLRRAPGSSRTWCCCRYATRATSASEPDESR